MAHFNIPHYSASNLFNADALEYLTRTPGALYTDGDTATWEKDSSSHRYANRVWLQDVSESFTEVVPGNAETFRQTLNADFTKMGTQAGVVNLNVNALNTSLSNAAKTGSADDVEESTTRKFASPTEKTYWNRKVWVDTSVNPAVVYQDGVDATTEFKALLTTTVPTLTSELDNESNFLVGTDYTKNNVVSAQEVSVSTYTEDALTADFPYKFSITLSGCNASMTPVVIFNQDDAVGGNFAQVAQSGTNCVYVWSKNTTAFSVPLVYAIAPDNITAV